MNLNELRVSKGLRKKRKRLGRGEGSGSGKTAGRGSKGQNSRSGGGVRIGFEGGQMPLQRRIPKRGFTNIFRKHYEVVNIKNLRHFKTGETIDHNAFQEAGLVKKGKAVKLLAEGEISYPLSIKVNKVSQAAKKKIESAGGEVEIV